MFQKWDIDINCNGYSSDILSINLGRNSKFIGTETAAFTLQLWTLKATLK